jgi:hypothetical protein
VGDVRRAPFRPERLHPVEMFERCSQRTRRPDVQKM